MLNLTLMLASTPAFLDSWGMLAFTSSAVIIARRSHKWIVQPELHQDGELFVYMVTSRIPRRLIISSLNGETNDISDYRINSVIRCC